MWGGHPPETRGATPRAHPNGLATPAINQAFPNKNETHTPNRSSASTGVRTSR